MRKLLFRGSARIRVPGAERFLDRYQTAMKKVWNPETMREHLLRAMQSEGALAVPSPEERPEEEP
jgi:hypothetical protein